MQDHFNFRLKPGRDDELIKWLNTRSRRERSAIIRAALWKQIGVDHSDSRNKDSSVH
jgi:hypothetical protein